MPPNYDFHTTGAQVALDNASAIQGKVILTTGVTPNTLGAAFLHNIAAYSPSLLILASRTPSALAATATSLASDHPSIQVRLLELDLNSQASVRRAAAEVNIYEEHIDVLVLNAGVMAIPYARTEEGVERQFGVNHLGHFLFTNLVVGRLGASARIVAVGSEGYRLEHIRFEDLTFRDGETYHPWRAYGQSKTANLLFARSLATKLGKRGVLSISICPGPVPTTNLSSHLDETYDGLLSFDKEIGTRYGFLDFTNFPMKNMEEGTATHVFAAFDQSLTLKYNGAYISDCHVQPAEDIWCWGRDSVDAEKLWKISEELVGQKFEY